MITGSLKIPQSIFDLKYAPLIRSGVDAGAKFVVGNAEGCDMMALSLLASMEYKNVSIYTSRGRGVDAIESLRMDVVNVEAGYKGRDLAMQKASNEIIFFASQYGSAGAGGMANFLAVKFGVENAYDVVDGIRSVLCPYSAELAEAAWKEESTKLF